MRLTTIIALIVFLAKPVAILATIFYLFSINSIAGAFALLLFLLKTL